MMRVDVNKNLNNKSDMTLFKKLYFTNSLDTVSKEHNLQRLLTFNVSNLMSILRCLLGMALRNQRSFHEKIKSRQNSGKVCYRLVQDLMSSYQLSKKVKITIYGTIILSLVLMGVNMDSDTEEMTQF
jgi:hypothetical protein